MHMGTVIDGCLLFKNINTSRMRGVWRNEQLPLHTLEWKFRLFIRKMTAGVTNGLLIMTPEWSTDFLDKLGDKQVVLQHMYLGRKGNAEILIKNFQSLKNNIGAALWYIRSNYGNAQNTWPKHTNLECSWTQNSDILTTPIYLRVFTCIVSYVQTYQVRKPLLQINSFRFSMQPWCGVALAPTMACGLMMPQLSA